MARNVFSWLVLIPLFAASLAKGGDTPRPATAYPHKTFTSRNFGTGAKSYWLFEPSEPTPAKAPVVVFHHGWLAVNPGVYGAWIEHLAKRGMIVIVPRYQVDWITRPIDFLPNSVSAVRDALDVLQTAPGHVRPDLDKFALIGHSAGGNLSAQMAAVAKEMGLPDPKAVIALMPGEVKPLREPILSRIPETTLLIVAAADSDHLVGDCRAREIYAEATSIPESRKEFLLFRSDHKGPTPLVADHLAPTAGLPLLDSGEGPFRLKQMAKANVDTLDRAGFWKMADLTLDAAFAGKTLDEASNSGALFKDLGRWEDGQLITPPISGDDLTTIPRVFPTNGVRLLPWNPDEFRRMLAEKP